MTVWLFQRQRHGVLVRDEDLMTAKAIAIAALGGELTAEPLVRSDSEWHDEESPFYDWEYLHVTMIETRN